MLKKYDYVVYIGRFQPFHEGHMDMLTQALELGSKVIVLVGSALKARQAKNPWTAAERCGMIKGSLHAEDYSRVYVLPVIDNPYDNESWVSDIISTVDAVTDEVGTIALIGHTKDDSSYYLSMFPGWDYVEIPKSLDIDGTDLRSIYFGSDVASIPCTGLSPYTESFLRDFASAGDYARLASEYHYIRDYKALWSHSPFPSILVTVDIAVIKDDKLLLITRGGQPGRGLLAMPGGYIDSKELLIVSAMRELQEETGLDYTLEQFKDLLVCDKVFDHPDRSQLGRCITTLYVLNLDGVDVNPVAGDDAAAVQWLSLSAIYSRREEFSGDHYDMAKFAMSAYNCGGTE